MTGTILDTIVASVRSGLPARKREMPVGTLQDRPLYGLDRRPLAPALKRENLAVIAEIKAASPSAGAIRESLDPGAIARAYTRAGADAISVVTEPDHFRGRIEFLESVRMLTPLPILRKDFIIDPYQLVEARAYGADAVLLIVSILETGQIRELMDAARELGLGTLVEIYERAELDRIELDVVRILGANNRDLRTFEVDTGRAARILADVPSSIVRVAESGIKTADDFQENRQKGIDAVLVGETLMASGDPAGTLATLRSAAAAVSRAET